MFASLPLPDIQGISGIPTLVACCIFQGAFTMIHLPSLSQPAIKYINLLLGFPEKLVKLVFLRSGTPATPETILRPKPMPSAVHQSHLFIIKDDKGRHEVMLDGTMYSIGRDPNCDIRLISQFVSRRHATLVQMPNEDGTFAYRIVDGVPRGKPSSNGLLINGRKLRAHDLQHEDKVVFGPNVSATYLSLKREELTAPRSEPDEFDVTLIGPNMVGHPEDA
jgi:hypothetical protein